MPWMSPRIVTEYYSRMVESWTTRYQPLTSQTTWPEKISSHEPTAVRRDPNQGASGEPMSSPSINNADVQGNQFRTRSAKSDESTPSVSATFSCQECGKTFGSRQELKDHTQQQH